MIVKYGVSSTTCEESNCFHAEEFVPEENTARPLFAVVPSAMSCKYEVDSVVSCHCPVDESNDELEQVEAAASPVQVPIAAAVGGRSDHDFAPVTLHDAVIGYVE